MSESLRFDTIFNLEGRIALVTGGGSGIGFQIASGLAANGAKVYISGRRLDVLEAAAKQIGGDIHMRVFTIHFSLHSSSDADTRPLSYNSG